MNDCKQFNTSVFFTCTRVEGSRAQCLNSSDTRLLFVCAHRDGPGGAYCKEDAPNAIAESVAEADVEKQGDG